MGVSGQRHAPARFAPGKGPRVGPRAGLDTEARGKIILPLSGIEPRSPGRPSRSQTLYWLSYAEFYTFPAVPLRKPSRNEPSQNQNDADNTRKSSGTHYCPIITSSSQRGVNILSAVRGGGVKSIKVDGKIPTGQR
jgi:hypothetical protein